MRKLVPPIVCGLLLVSACSASPTQSESPGSLKQSESPGTPTSSGSVAAVGLVLAQDKGAQAVLRNGLVAAKVYFTQGDTFSGFDPTVAAEIEPALEWQSDEPVEVGVVSINLVREGQVVLSTLSESGNTFCLTDDIESDRTYYGRFDAVGATSLSDCGGTADGWSSEANMT